jgi:hypothetical protein
VVLAKKCNSKSVVNDSNADVKEVKMSFVNMANARSPTGLDYKPGAMVVSEGKPSVDMSPF